MLITAAEPRTAIYEYCTKTIEVYRAGLFES